MYIVAYYMVLRHRTLFKKQIICHCHEVSKHVLKAALNVSQCRLRFGNHVE